MQMCKEILAVFLNPWSQIQEQQAGNLLCPSRQLHPPVPVVVVVSCNDVVMVLKILYRTHVVVVRIVEK